MRFFLFVGVMVLLGCTAPPAGGAAEPEASGTAAYRRRCESQCAGSGGGETCAAYCRCELRTLERTGHLERALQLAHDGREGRIVEEPWFVDVYAACGASHGDHTFLGDCESGCPQQDATCSALCECCLEKVREGMSREAGTRWIFERYALDPPPPDVIERIDAARAACASRMGLAVEAPGPGVVPVARPADEGSRAPASR